MIINITIIDIMSLYWMRLTSAGFSQFFHVLFVAIHVIKGHVVVKSLISHFQL